MHNTPFAFFVFDFKLYAKKVYCKLYSVKGRIFQKKRAQKRQKCNKKIGDISKKDLKFRDLTPFN